MFRSISKHRPSRTSHSLARKDRNRRRRFALESLEPRMMLTGNWTPLTNLAPNGIGTMLLLSDGTVLAHGSTGQTGKSWYRLTPDASGNYVNGTWSQLSDMSLERLYFAANTLPDGRVLVEGGIYSGPNTVKNNTNTGEIYDPVANTWTSISNFPESTFGSAPSMLLADGRVLAGYRSGPQTYIYDPATNAWSAGPTKLDNDQSYRETWTKLSDGSILSYNIWGNAGHAQRFDPATNSWIDAGTPPAPLYDPADPLAGPALLLPDGRTFQSGGTSSNTALYTPSPTPGGAGSWAAGPTRADATRLAPAAMLPDGHVLLAGGTGGGNNPTSTNFVEFDPVANSLTVVPTPSSAVAGWPSWGTRMLMLPNGQALFTYEHTQLYVYTAGGSPQSAWKPTITSVVPNGNHYTLTGTQLNGLSAGASYSGQAAMDSNYPVVELKDGSGKVYFARTSNWSSTGVATGSTPVSTDFAIPAYLPYGTYSLTVVANGIASDPVSFTGGSIGTSADLAVSYTAPSNISEWDNFTYNVTVKNNGPTSATGAVLTVTLDPNLTYISATTSRGTFTRSGNTLTFTIGSLAVGQAATATITVQKQEDGVVTSTASVTGGVFDADTSNNSVVATTTVYEPPIYVSAPITFSGKKINGQVATFGHANGIEPVSAFVATINWGDGTTSTGTISSFRAGYQVKGSHTYATSGTYTVTTTVVESENVQVAVSAMALVGSTSDGNSSTASGATGGAALATPLTPGATIGVMSLKANVVDQLLSTVAKLRSRRALADGDEVSSTDVLDQLFVLN